MTGNNEPEGVTLQESLANAPKNWGRWGPDDEVGSTNFIDAEAVRSASQTIVSGQVITLGLPIGDPRGEPIYPGRAQSMRYNTQDRGSYVAGKRTPFPGGLEYADDIMIMFLQGSTQVDALAHIWYDETTYNGYSADTTVGGLSRASVLPLANRGIVGRAVLVDIARYRNVDALDRGEEFTLDEMLDAARSQDLTIHPHDVLLVRTGWIPMFYEKGAAEFYRPPFEEPGLLYEPKVAKWFHEQEIVGWGTDTIGNELSVQPETLIRGSALHAALMRNLGVIFIEMLWLEELAKECAADGRYEFFFVCSPLKIHGATGSPVNPIAIR